MQAASRILTRSLFALSAALLVVAFSADRALAQSEGLPNRNDALEGITTSGQPSAEGLAAAAEAGYKTVIDLRSPAEDRGMDEPAAVEALGMSYISLPVAGGDGVTYENARVLDRLLDDAPGPVLLHCASSNRVGALLALRAKMHGADDEAALELGLASGLSSLRPVVESKLAAGKD